MKKLLLLVSFVASFLGVEAQKVVVDGVIFDIVNNEYAVVSGYDDNFLKDGNGNYIIPLVINSDVEFNLNNEKFNVTEIGKTAFKDCKNLRHINLNGIKKIGESAFESSGLEAVACGDEVVEIESRAFADCQNLESVYIPASATKLGKELFAQCDLKMLTVEKCNDSFLKTIDFVDHSEDVTVKDYFENIFGLKTMQGIIFATDKDDLQVVIDEMPDFFNDMVKVEVEYISSESFTNVFPFSLSPVIEEQPDFDENNFEYFEGVNPNAVWPDYEIMVDKESALSVLLVADFLQGAPEMKHVNKRTSQYVGFNDMALDFAGSGMFMFNDPTYYFTNDMKPQYCAYYNTPVISENSRLVIRPRSGSISNVTDAGECYDVYLVSGRLVGRGVTVTATDNLAKGTYILKSENSVRKIQK